jgi:hypothetical protein
LLYATMSTEQREAQLEYICTHIDNLTVKQRLDIAKMIWKQDKLGSKMKEKGIGIEINTKHMSTEFVERLYHAVKALDYVDEELLCAQTDPA